MQTASISLKIWDIEMLMWGRSAAALEMVLKTSLWRSEGHIEWSWGDTDKAVSAIIKVRWACCLGKKYGCRSTPWCSYQSSIMGSIFQPNMSRKTSPRRVHSSKSGALRDDLLWAELHFMYSIRVGKYCLYLSASTVLHRAAEVICWAKKMLCSDSKCKHLS